MNKPTNQAVFEQIVSYLNNAQNILVVSHIDPDGDALGTQLAVGNYLTSIGKNVTMLRDSSIPVKYSFLPNVSDIVHADSLPDNFSVDMVIILECPTLERTGTAKKYIESEETKIINIDHHLDALTIGDVNWVDVKSSSVGEMIYEFFDYIGYKIDEKTAIQLYTAILTDTGRFRYESTSPRTMEIGARLIEAGAKPREICDTVYYSMPSSTMKLVGKVLESIEYYDSEQICLLSMTNKMLKESGADPSESDGLVDFTLFTQSVHVGGLLKEVDDTTTKVSLRSNNEINVAEIAAEFGGGGHSKAAGCTIRDDIEKAREIILDRLTEALKNV